MYEPKTKLNLFFRQKISRLLNWYEHSGVVSKRVYHCEECGGAHGAEFRLEREPGVEQE